MTTTTIRRTCTSCQRTIEAPTARLVLALPASTASAEPSFIHMCPICRACELVAVSWRTASYLLAAGTTTVTTPDPRQLAPRYPEHRPPATSPMTLDDLIDLYAALDTDTTG